MSSPRYTLEEGLARLRGWCDLQERCPSEVRRKLRVWKYDEATISDWLKQLTEEGAVDEYRYAQAFVSGKFRMKRWGKRKIQAELKFRDISVDFILQALDEIDPEDYANSLNVVLERKIRNTPLTDRASKGSVARHAISKGYEPDLVWDAIATKSKG